MYCRACKVGVLKVTKTQPKISGAIQRTRVCNGCQEVVVTYERPASEALNEYERRLVNKFRAMRPTTRAALWAFLRSTGGNT